MTEKQEVRIRRDIGEALESVRIIDATLPLDPKIQKELFIAFNSKINDLNAHIFSIIIKEINNG